MFTLVLHLQKTSSRHLQDVLFKTNLLDLAIRLQDAFQKRLQDIFKMPAGRFEDVFYTSSRHLKKSCQGVFKTSPKRVQDILKKVFKTSSRGLQDVLKTSCKNIFKTFSGRNLVNMSLTRLLNASETVLFQRRLYAEQYA